MVAHVDILAEFRQIESGGRNMRSARPDTYITHPFIGLRSRSVVLAVNDSSVLPVMLPPHALGLSCRRPGRHLHLRMSGASSRPNIVVNIIPVDLPIDLCDDRPDCVGHSLIRPVC